MGMGGSGESTTMTPGPVFGGLDRRESDSPCLVDCEAGSGDREGPPDPGHWRSRWRLMSCEGTSRLHIGHSTTTSDQQSQPSLARED